MWTAGGLTYGAVRTGKEKMLWKQPFAIMI